jgi:hypothetical protein
MAFALVSLVALEARAIVITPPADTHDTWIQPAAGNNHSGWAADGISTMAVGVGPGGSTGRYGVAIFDLSSIAGTPVTEVRLQLGNVGQFVEPLTLVSTYVTSAIGAAYPVDLQTGNFSGDYYVNNIQPVEQSFETLGSDTYSSANDPPDETYGDVGIASAADIAVFNTARQLPNPSIMIIYKATAGARDWGDTGYHTLPPLLLINEPLPPEPPFGDLDGDFDIDLVDYGILTDPNHWLQAVTPNTNGDLNSTGFVDLLDFALFKGAYTEFNGGSSGLSEPVPEPSTWVLLGLTTPTWFAYRRWRGSR